MIGLNDERRLRRLDRFQGERESRLARELPQKSCDRAIETRLRMPAESH